MPKYHATLQTPEGVKIDGGIHLKRDKALACLERMAIRDVYYGESREYFDGATDGGNDNGPAPCRFLITEVHLYGKPKDAE